MRQIRFEIVNDAVKENAIRQIKEIQPDSKSPLIVTIQEKTRSLSQNARLHAMLSDIAKQAEYLGKKRTIDFWKGLFVSGWMIATGYKAEIIPGLEGEFINIRVSTTTLSKRDLNELMEYIEAWCGVNGVRLSTWRTYND